MTDAKGPAGLAGIVAAADNFLPSEYRIDGYVDIEQTFRILKLMPCQVDMTAQPVTALLRD